MKVGDSEVMFASLAQRASQARSRGDNEEAQHLWEESFHLARARFGLQADPDEYSATTTAVINSLSTSWTVHTTPSGRSPVPIIDAIIDAGDIRLGLVVRAGPAFKPTAVVTSLEQAMRDSGLQLRGFLVVVNCDQSEDKLERFQQLSEMLGIPVVPVGWKIGEKPLRLQGALEELIRRVSNPDSDTLVHAETRGQLRPDGATEKTTVRQRVGGSSQPSTSTRGPDNAKRRPDGGGANTRRAKQARGEQSKD